MKIEIIRGTVTTDRRGLEASGLWACWAPFRQKKFLFSFFLSLASFYPFTIGKDYCCTWLYSVTHTHDWTPLAEGSTRRRDLYVAKHNISDKIRTRNPSKRPQSTPNDIIINIKDWTLWSVPSPELQLLSPTLLRSSNCSPSLWFVAVWFQRD